MTDNKLTDNEIIKALECFAIDKDFDETHCVGCAFEHQFCTANMSEDIAKPALSLINHQKAEIERLKNYVKSEDEVRAIAKRTMEPLVKEITREQIDIAVKLAKAEAYKECIEKVKEYIDTHEHLTCEECECVPISKNGLDNLLKELVGENK